MPVHNWFSNFIPFDIPLIYTDLQKDIISDEKLSYLPISYITPEHFYQAMKSQYHLDHQKIAAAKTAAIAKKLGKSLIVRPDWNEVKLNVMEYVLNYKFTKNTTHGQKLIKTIEPIIEYNYWHDNYWGNCTCKKCENIIKKNYLGKILEEIRFKISI